MFTNPIIKSIIFVLSIIYCGITYYSLIMSIPQPVASIPSTNRAQVALVKVGAPRNKINDLSRAVTGASAMTSLSPELIVALMKTESEFNYRAVSSKGYRGLMQTPWASMKWAEVDILYGSKILQEKLKFSNNNLQLALALYKGGNNKLAHRYAAETIRVYRRLL